tara:strand:+ start:1665 stop:1973 length:309 start_codon:yes stop_codon:yes gene_type:complete
MTWVDNKQWKYERDKQLKKVIISKYSRKHEKMMPWTIIKFIDDKVVFSQLKDDQPFAKYLIQEGVLGMDGKRYYPKDGLDFMSQLKFHFRGGYTTATDIIDD